MSNYQNCLNANLKMLFKTEYNTTSRIHIHLFFACGLHAYTYACSHVCGCMCTQLCVEGRGWHTFFSIIIYFIYWGRPLSESRAPWLCCLVGQFALSAWRSAGRTSRPPCPPGFQWVLGLDRAPVAVLSAKQGLHPRSHLPHPTHVCS